MIEIVDKRTGVISKIPIPYVEGKITIYKSEFDYIANTTTKNIDQNFEIKDLKELLRERQKNKRKEYMREYQRKRRELKKKENKNG